MRVPRTARISSTTRNDVLFRGALACGLLPGGWTETSTARGAGGGGGAIQSNSYQGGCGAGGRGGGGPVVGRSASHPDDPNEEGYAGAPGTGGGGPAAYGSQTARSGGSGIVIVRYTQPPNLKPREWVPPIQHLERFPDVTSRRTSGDRLK